MIPTRKSLLSRLKNLNDEESWNDFFETYWALIYNTAIEAGLGDAEAHDVVQETVIYVTKKMPGFNYDPAQGSFKAWLRQLIRWQIVSAFRRRQKDIVPLQEHPDHSTSTSPLEKMPDPRSLEETDTRWDREWEKALLAAATKHIKARVDPKQFQIFHFATAKDWPVQKVAKTLRVSPARVYLVKHRITRLLKQEVARLRKSPFKGAPWTERTS